jgi:hypothetical protein
LAVGQSDRADVLLKEYLHRYRREPWDPPAHLLDTLLGLLSNSPAAEQLKGSFAAHSQR